MATSSGLILPVAGLLPSGIPVERNHYSNPVAQAGHSGPMNQPRRGSETLRGGGRWPVSHAAADWVIVQPLVGHDNSRAEEPPLGEDTLRRYPTWCLVL